MRSSVLILILILSGYAIQARKIEKVFLDKQDTTRNYYTLIYPDKQVWKGYLLLMPGMGETPENVLKQTDLPLIAADRGLLVIIPVLQDGVLSLGVDRQGQETIAQIMTDIRAKHKLQDLPYYAGGFSIGASTIIKYTEETRQKPAAIFAIDPPLDFERFYKACKRDIRLSVTDKPNQENIYMTGRLEQATQGAPENNLAAYYSISPYAYSDTSQSAIRKLLQTPVRLYTEPDVSWWLNERKADFTGMNATDCAAMINELKRLGHPDANLIVTRDKGYREPGHKRHPHSWSITDSEALINWLLQYTSGN